MDKSTDGQFPKSPLGLFIQKLYILIFFDIVVLWWGARSREN